MLQVRGIEVTIVVLVLMVWVGAIILFFNRWGKIRMLIPYQPDYKETQLKVPGTGACSSSNTYQNQSGSALCCSQVRASLYHLVPICCRCFRSIRCSNDIVGFRVVAAFWTIVSNIVLVRHPLLQRLRYTLGTVTVVLRYYIGHRSRINLRDLSKNDHNVCFVEVDRTSYTFLKCDCELL